MSKYYYDIEGNEYEIVNREPTEEERKRAKESLEKAMKRQDLSEKDC